MSSTTVKSHVPFGAKVAFGMGMFANQMFPAVLGIFMVVLVQDLGFPGWMWGVIYFFPRVFDSITDPIMGFISDNTKSKWGRRKQYVFLGAVIMGIAFITMWQLYRENGVDYNFAYFLGWSFLFYLGLTIFSVPYVAIGYEMSDDFHERTNIMAVAQWVGQWAWVIAPWFWVIMYDQDLFSSAEVATRQLAIWVGLVCMLFAMIPAIFIKSRSTIDEDYSPLTFRTIGRSLGEIFQGFKQAFNLKPFRKLCIATFFIFNAFNTIAAFSFFIIVYYLFSGDAEDAGYWPTLFGSLGALVTTFVVIPIVAKMSKVLGKKRAFLVSQSISILGYLSLWFLFIPGKPYMFIIALPFHSFGIGSLFVLMMSMTADVIDMDELNTGLRREGIFGAIYWWMVKFGFAIAGGLSGVILSVVGFNAELGQQTVETLTGLRLFYSGVPIFGTLIALLVMWNYDVTEEKANEVRAEIARRKATKMSTAAFMRDKLYALDKNFVSKPLIDLSKSTTSELRVLFSKAVDIGVHGLCFSPYEEGQQVGDALSKNQIERRMDIIAPTTKWVRSFSCSGGNELIPEVAKEKGLKTMVGAWISNHKGGSQEEIDALVKLANKGCVDIAAVGNEVLLREELSEEEVIKYIQQVRELLPPNVQIGYVDAYYQFIERPALVEACDLVLANLYPYWEGIDNDGAGYSVQRMYELTKKAAKGKKVIISETGWPSDGKGVGSAMPSEENAMKFFINIQKWSNEEDIEMFYFSSFDEPWKVAYEGEVGGHWGLWDKDEVLKYAALESQKV
ncbi:MAG TPA: MFS transporter [Cyclobacteriaceae bacterium]